MQLRQGCDSVDWFSLAMAHWQLGETEKARQCYDRAVQWMDKNQQALEKDKPHQEELRRFRAEAAELLGVKQNEGKLKDTKTLGGEKPGDDGQK